MLQPLKMWADSDIVVPKRGLEEALEAECHKELFNIESSQALTILKLVYLGDSAYHNWLRAEPPQSLSIGRQT